MNNNEHEIYNSEQASSAESVSKKTIYDGIRITKRGADALVGIISLVLIILFIFALSRS